MENFEDKASKYGRIYKVAGPRRWLLCILIFILVVVGENMSGSKMYELVKIGWDKLVGEIIKLEGDTASIQCYEDTCKSIHQININILQLDSPMVTQFLEQETHFP